MPQTRRGSIPDDYTAANTSLRRSRIAQIPAAFWLDSESSATLVCFRSVAQYAFDLLADAVKTGSEVFER